MYNYIDPVLFLFIYVEFYIRQKISYAFEENLKIVMNTSELFTVN